MEKAKLWKVVGSIKDFPKEDKNYFVFLGRSNVGKSSLINHLLREKNLARVGKDPGKTRNVYFYEIGGTDDCFVDFPGYGYAATSKTERYRFKKLMDYFLQTNQNIQKIILLVDSRHAPTEKDIAFYDWIKTLKQRHIVFGTKADKLRTRDINPNSKLIIEKLDISNTENFALVSVLKSPYKEIWKLLRN